MSSRSLAARPIAVVNAVIAMAGGVVLVHLSRDGGREMNPPPASDLHNLSESMLVDENSVPPLDRDELGSHRGSANGLGPAGEPA